MSWKVRIHRMGGRSTESTAFATAELAEDWAYANVTPDDGTFEIFEERLQLECSPRIESPPGSPARVAFEEAIAAAASRETIMVSDICRRSRFIGLTHTVLQDGRIRTAVVHSGCLVPQCPHQTDEAHVHPLGARCIHGAPWWRDDCPHCSTPLMKAHGADLRGKLGIGPGEAIPTSYELAVAELQRAYAGTTAEDVEARIRDIHEHRHAMLDAAVQSILDED